MNRYDSILRLLGSTLCGSALILVQHSAGAQDAAPKSSDAAPTGPISPASDTPAADAPASNDTPRPVPATTTTSTSPAEATPRDVPPVSDPPEPPQANESSKANRVRFEVGGRLGYAMPFGHIATSNNLKDVFAASVPGVLDGWVRFPGGFALGLYLGLAAGVSGHALDSCPNCSALDYRFGVQVARHFNDGGVVDPWLGVGIGGEWASITEQIDYQGYDITADDTYSALPEISLHAGVDIGSDTIAFGPYASVSYSSFSKVKSTLSCSNIGCDDGVASSSDVNGGGHGWISLGVRGTYLR